jgi:hypothetical protein
MGANRKQAQRAQLGRLALAARRRVGRLALEGIVRALNEGFNAEHRLAAEAHANLIRLIQAWQAARDARHPFEVGDLRGSVPRLFKMKLPPGCPPLHEIENRCRVRIGVGVGSAGANFGIVYQGEKGKPWSAWDAALQQFVELIKNPECDKFAGPCARKTCGKYYIKKRASQKVYCSRTCGNETTAAARTKMKWDAQHAKKLKLAKRAMREWFRSKTSEPFQGWAEKHYPGLTKKFLTRAINKKDLPRPIKERR